MYATYSIVEENYYQNLEGQPYSSERIYKTMLTELEAKVLAAELNSSRVGDVYYSIRKIG